MTTINMPQLGETVVEGTILKWLKQEGDQVSLDEPLFEISTDKVDTEVPSPAAGTVTKILVQEGQTVGVGTPVAEVDAGDGQAASAAPAAEAEAATQARPPGEAPPGEAAGAPVQSSAPVETPQAEPAAAVAAAQPPAVSATTTPTTTVPDRGPRSQILSPLVRRLADEHGVDLSQVAGTGTGEDVAPISHVRRAIGEHMLASSQQTARAWTLVEVNVEHLVRLRERVRDAFEQTHGVKLTYLPFVVRATVDALQAFPQVNSRLDGDNVVTPRYVNMGIAVSYDAGLIVPVVMGADAMNSVGIARAITDLAARARSHQLKPDEVHGATFTITNPGPYGSIASVPIINQPNTGILSLDAIAKRPVVIDDAIAIRHMVNVSMSWDHRTIDGELATRFLARVKQNLESWDFAEDLGV